MNLTLISGLSGSGKSVALNALEDLGYFCVDNLPGPVIFSLIDWLEHEKRSGKAAVSIDTRSYRDLESIENLLKELQAAGHILNVLFLETADNILLQRFAQTHRNHPLMRPGVSLNQAIALEREILWPMRALSYTVDTSQMNEPQLCQSIYTWLGIAGIPFSPVFFSFGFKYGMPADADYIFDVRTLPNPYWRNDLRHFSGLDEPVRRFFAQDCAAENMVTDIAAFLAQRLAEFRKNRRRHLAVGIGCTGGMHRSVYVAQRLAEHFSRDYPVILRHRQLAQKDTILADPDSADNP